MTQLIEIGKTANNQTKVPIVFDYAFTRLPPVSNTFGKTTDTPETFKYIELICRSYLQNKDLMFAYDNPNHRYAGILFVGNWNDGVIG